MGEKTKSTEREPRPSPFLFVFVASLAAFILLGPGYRQVLHRDAPWVPRWVMFSGKGLGILRVHVERTLAGEPRTTVLLEELTRPKRSNGRLIAPVVKDESSVERLAQRLCREYGGKASVYLTVDRAVRSGWRPVLDGRRDYCKGSPRRGQKPRGQK